MPAPAPVPPPPVASVAAPGVPAPAPLAPRAPPCAARTFEEVLAALARDAASGADPALSGHADLLDEVARLAPPAGEKTRIVRLPEAEARAVERAGRGTAFARATTYVEAGAPPEALRRATMDYDRLAEWTGHPGTRVLSRDGGTAVCETDAVRSFLALSFGVKWRFEAKALDRGEARVVVTRMVQPEVAEHVLLARSVWVGVPVAGGTRVVEVSSSAVDYDVPGLVRGVAEGSAKKEMLARTAGIRGHWREYLR
jgi:hypothetical protein